MLIFIVKDRFYKKNIINTNNIFKIFKVKKYYNDKIQFKLKLKKSIKISREHYEIDPTLMMRGYYDVKLKEIIIYHHENNYDFDLSSEEIYKIILDYLNKYMKKYCKKEYEYIKLILC